jgi:hypothetical protein
MDANVIAAIARWPDVPAVYGWLSLSARGQWRIRGEPISNAAINEFIGRNYARDAQGRWFFQNGPQRVYVSLDLAPWVFRVQPDGSLRTFTGREPRSLVAAALVDRAHFVLLTDLGAGNIDDRDLSQFLSSLVDSGGRPTGEAGLDRLLAGQQAAWVAAERCHLEGGSAPIRSMRDDDLGATYGFQRQPAPG